MAEQLDPVDAARCQAEIREGSFMTLGPRAMKRCTHLPRWLGMAVIDGKVSGAMSLCDSCKKVCEVLVPEAVYQRLIGGKQ